MKRLPKGHKAQIMGTRMFQTMYTADQMRKFAQPSKPWVGLTDAETGHWAADFLAGAKWAETKLREKNA